MGFTIQEIWDNSRSRASRFEISQFDLDKRYLATDVPHSNITAHSNQGNIVKSLIKSGDRILEEGS